MDENQPPQVSVVIPIYNRPQLLERSLGSVLAQTVSNIEIIVVDDQSDQPLDSHISGYNDPRIRLLRLAERSGVSAARNIGIENCRGAYIAFLDSDDQWHADKLAKQLNFMAQNPHLRLVHTEEIWIRKGKRVNQCKHHQKSGGNFFYPSLRRCLISPSAVFIKRSVFDDYGTFDTSLPVCEDYDLWLRITAREEVGFINKPLITKYGGHEDQLSTAYPAMDRYRVQSMMKLLDECQLTDADRQEIHSVIYQKSTILFHGAQKRNLPEVELYQGWMKQSALLGAGKAEDVIDPTPLGQT